MSSKFEVVPKERTVNSKTLEFDINLDKIDVGLGNIDNTSDANKPVSTAMTTALALKADLAAAWAFTNNPTRTIQTVAAAGNGWQLSATRNSMAAYSTNVSTTATIGGTSDGYVVMEVCSTNSAVAANWQEVCRTRNGQAITLAIALQSTQNISGHLMGIIPSGWYVRLRSVNTSGTPVYAFVSGQEVLL